MSIYESSIVYVHIITYVHVKNCLLPANLNLFGQHCPSTCWERATNLSRSLGKGLVTDPQQILPLKLWGVQKQQKHSTNSVKHIGHILTGLFHHPRIVRQFGNVHRELSTKWWRKDMCCLIPIDVLTNTVPNTRSCPKKCQKHTKEITHFQESLAPRNSSNQLTALVSETDLDGDVVHHTPAFLGASAVHPRNRMWVGSPQL